MSLSIQSGAVYPVEAYAAVKGKLQGLYTDSMIAFLRAKGSREDIEEWERRSPPLLFVGEERNEEKITRILGQGGCKRAYQLSNGRALILPNMSVDGLTEIQSRWSRIVEEEVWMSKLLQENGLLGMQMQKVNVYAEEDAEHSIPAYIAESFEALAERHIYVIDVKNSSSSTWKGKLFDSLDEANNPENWRPVLEHLATDISKLIHCQFPLGGDSFNIAVVKELSGYKIRYFGFDFTEKSGPLPTKKIRGEEDFSSKVERAFSIAIEHVLFNEYGASCFLPSEAYTLLASLKRNLLHEFLSN